MDRDFAAGRDRHEGEVLQLPGERMLVDHAAAGSEDVVLHAVAIGIALHRVKVAGDHRIDAVLREQRVHALVPPRRAGSPHRPMREEQDRLAACGGLFERCFEPGEILRRERHALLAATTIAVDDDHRGARQFRDVPQRPEGSSVPLVEGRIVRIAGAAHHIVVPRDRKHRSLERRDDLDPLRRLAIPLLGRAGVSLHHVADREDHVRIEPPQILDRGPEVGQAPVASGRAVGQDREPQRAGRQLDGERLSVGRGAVGIGSPWSVEDLRRGGLVLNRVGDAGEGKQGRDRGSGDRVGGVAHARSVRRGASRGRLGHEPSRTLHGSLDRVREWNALSGSSASRRPATVRVA